MDEVTAGVIALAETSGAITEENEGWTYAIHVAPESWSSVQDSTSGATVNGLTTVIVTVTYQIPGSAVANVEYSLSRLILDPSLRQPVAPPQPQTQPSK